MQVTFLHTRTEGWMHRQGIVFFPFEFRPPAVLIVFITRPVSLDSPLYPLPRSQDSLVIKTLGSHYGHREVVFIIYSIQQSSKRPLFLKITVELPNDV
jgi:hypothetical protein